MLRLFFFLCLTSFLSCAFALQVIDDADHHITIKAPAKRIITLAPDLTEIIFALGKGGNIIATVDSSDYPSQAKQIPRIGSYMGIDLERIVALKPDLIVTWGTNFQQPLASLQRMGIPVYVHKPRLLQDVANSMQHLAILTGSNIPLAKQFNARLQQLNKQYAREKKLRVFYQIGTYSLITINKDSWINQAITLCGGENVFALSKGIAPVVNWEAVVLANPDVVLTDSGDKEWQKRWQNWSAINAVKNHALYALKADWIDRAGPRLIFGIEQMCQKLAQARQHTSN